MNLPILFVVENNLYSSHLDIKLRQPGDRVSRFAEANNIRTEVVDGNDVNQITIKATTNEKSGLIGSGDFIACWSNVSLKVN